MSQRIEADTPRRADSRQRMVQAAVELFGRRGYHATTFADVIEASGAPRGSIYFHFPGGKQELAQASIAAAGDEIVGLCQRAADGADSPADYVQALSALVGERLAETGYERGCAVATMVLELVPRDEQLGAAFEDGFHRWRRVMTEHLRGWGLGAGEAEDAAVLIMSALEGALVLARALRTLEPLQVATRQLVAHLPAPKRG